MATKKVTVSLRIDKDIVESMDRLIAKRRPFIRDRSHMIAMAIVEFANRQIAQQASEAAAAAAEEASASARAAAKATAEAKGKKRSIPVGS